MRLISKYVMYALLAGSALSIGCTAPDPGTFSPGGSPPQTPRPNPTPGPTNSSGPARASLGSLGVFGWDEVLPPEKRARVQEYEDWGVEIDDHGEQVAFYRVEGVSCWPDAITAEGRTVAELRCEDGWESGSFFVDLPNDAVGFDSEEVIAILETGDLDDLGYGVDGSASAQCQALAAKTVESLFIGHLFFAGAATAVFFGQAPAAAAIGTLAFAEYRNAMRDKQDWEAAGCNHGQSILADYLEYRNNNSWW